jgi:eukaryotic-like serine/threonine-protein kinase
MLASRAVMIQIIAAASVTGVFATPFPEVAQAQGNSTSPAPISNSEGAPLSKSTAATSTAYTNFLTYGNSTWGIKIQYPSNWTKQTAGQGVTFIILANEKNHTSNDNAEQFLAKLNVTSIAEIPPNAPLNALADRIIVSYMHFLSNFQMQSYTNTTLGGNNNAIKIAYSYVDPKNNSFNATDVATIKNGRLYAIQYYYSSQSPKHETYLQTLQKMINLFQIAG